MKILKSILNVAVWTVLGLYLMFILTFSIPAVQEYMGHRTASLLAQKLGTSVSCERLDFGIPSHITLYHLSIRDQRGRDMLYARRVSARVDLLPLAEGRVSISSAQLFGVFAKLYQADASSKPNFQFVLDSLASKDTTSTTPLDLRINSLIVRDTRISYNQLDAPHTPGILNPRHLDIQNISSHVIVKVLREDTINVNIKRLALKEQSGLDIRRLGLHFSGGRNGCRLDDFLLRMQGTDIRLGDMVATYRFRGDHFVTPSLAYSGSIKPSTVTLADLACLLPSLKTFHSTLSLQSTFSGTGDKLKVPSLAVSSTTGDVSINIQGEIRELRQAVPRWTTTINDLSLSAKTISFISENLKGQRLEVPQELVRMGDIHLTGVADGQGVQQVQARCQLNTGAGHVSLTLAMDPQHRFTGNIDTRGIDLGRILDNSHLGMLATEIALSGQLPGGGPAQVKADGIVQQFHYNGYDYRNISINALYSPQDIHGRLSIDDSNIGLKIEGAVVKDRQQSNVKLAASISQLSPQAINMTDRWGDARFSTTVNADFTASSLGDAVGMLQVSNLSMQSAKEQYQLDQLRVESGYDGDIHYITLDSDFGQTAIRGDFDYKTLAQSLTRIVSEKLPTLPGLPHASTAAKNNFTLQATINKSDWLQHLLAIPLRLDRPLTLEGMVNDHTRQVDVVCDIPLFYYENNRYDHGHVSIKSPDDTLSVTATVTKMMDNGDHFDIGISGKASDNRLLACLEWDNHQPERMSGQIVGKAHFNTAPDGQKLTHVTLEPSTLMLHGTQWDIHPCHINYYDKHLDVSNFTIRHQDQFLSLDGRASESNQDSLRISMKGINIDYVLDLVNFHAVDFSGLATGGGTVRGVFGNFEADAQLSVSDFEFQHGRMGTLHANVGWNKENEQIDIRATADDGPEAKTHISGYVSPLHNTIDLSIQADGTSLAFAQSFTESFIGSIAGQGHGLVRLAGPLDAINLTGQLVLDGRALITPLNCVYELRSDTLLLVPNEIEFRQCAIYDKHGNRATLTGGIHHQELTNLTFDIFVNTDNLLAYDFNNFGNSTFYGTVFAAGNVAIHGRDEGVVIDADVTPQSNSVFVYNAASPNTISDQEFIHWGVVKPKSSEYPKRSENSDYPESSTHSGPTPSAEYREDLRLNLKINVTPNATIRLLMDERTSDYITLRGNGELQTSFYNKGGFDMFGTYRVAEGTYGLTIQNIIRKNFVFREGGTIVFSGDPYNAALNLQAVNTVNGVSLSDLNVGRSFSNTVRVNCLMNITGQPRQPQVDFDMEMPNVNADEQQMVRSIINSEEEMNQQVVYLLAVGRFYPQGANNAATDDTGGQSKTTLAMQSLLSGTLSGQINNVLGKVIKSNNWNFGANISTGDEGWNNAEYEGLISGRLLNNRLLINGQFGYRDKATTETPSFIGDFDIRYLLYPNGNMALKVYNQTNDRYFTKSSLNTQGIGIIMKKDFSGFADLFGIRKRKKQQDK